MKFEGIVLCAGFGTRLAPITQLIPKAAVPIHSQPAALNSLQAFFAAGIHTVHINLHHLAETAERELTHSIDRLGIPRQRVRFWREPEILETGGGIANIAHRLREEGCPPPDGFLVVAGDVYATPPLTQMINLWSQRDHATGCLLTTRSLNTLRPDVTWVNTQTEQVVGFGEDFSAPSLPIQPRLFTTHQIIATDLVLDQPVLKQSSRDIYFRKSLQQNRPILNLDATGLPWWDIGQPMDYLRCLQASMPPDVSKPPSCLSPHSTFAGWVQAALIWEHNGKQIAVDEVVTQALTDGKINPQTPPSQNTNHLVIGVPTNQPSLRSGTLIAFNDVIRCLSADSSIFVANAAVPIQIDLLFQQQ